LCRKKTIPAQFFPNLFFNFNLGHESTFFLFTCKFFFGLKKKMHRARAVLLTSLRKVGGRQKKKKKKNHLMCLLCCCTETAACNTPARHAHSTAKQQNSNIVKLDY